jgi:hypothetical protein
MLSVGDRDEPACIEHMFAHGADEKLHTGPPLSYDGRVTSLDDAAVTPSTAGSGFVRDPLASRAATLAAREHSMSERLELALSWNAVAAELRAGMKVAASRRITIGERFGDV